MTKMFNDATAISISTANTKLGPQIAAWSIAPIVSCPGASNVCRELTPDGNAPPKPRCFGCRNRFAENKFKECYLRHMLAAKSPNFVKNICALIRRTSCFAIRINDLGDFFSVPYICEWQKIVQQFRKLLFFAYTRSWRCADLWPALQKLAAEPNMRLLLSVDHSCVSELPRVPMADQYPLAWLAVDDDDAPPRPVHVVFRDQREKLPRSDQHRFGSPVCRAEIAGVDITCDRCQHCLTCRQVPFVAQPEITALQFAQPVGLGCTQ